MMPGPVRCAVEERSLLNGFVAWREFFNLLWKLN